MRAPREPAAFALIASVLFAGCSFQASIRHQYRTTIAGPSLASVAVEAVNHRPLERGGQGARIGRVRGFFGIPHRLDELDAPSIARTSTDAVIDGLARAGISVDDHAEQKLVVAVNDYWIDGYLGVNASVKLDLTLQDARGAPVWQQSVGSMGGTFANILSPGASQTAFTIALQHVALQCSELFRSDEFRRQLGLPVPPPPPEEAPVGAQDWLRTLAGHFGAPLGHPRELLDGEGERPGGF
jgi:hypothetical protein